MALKPVNMSERTTARIQLNSVGQNAVCWLLSLHHCSLLLNQYKIKHHFSSEKNCTVLYGFNFGYNWVKYCYMNGVYVPPEYETWLFVRSKRTYKYGVEREVHFARRRITVQDQLCSTQIVVDFVVNKYVHRKHKGLYFCLHMLGLLFTRDEQ